MKQVISTEQAPKAIGTYSQAIKVGQTVYFSGQIPLVPETMEIVKGDFTAHVKQVFENLSAVAKAAGGSLAHIVKINIYLLEMSHFPQVNEVMATYFQEPYPARAVVAVKQLPKDVPIEIEAVMVVSE